MAEWIPYTICVLQSIQTGSFLTLDIVTNSLKEVWGFSGDEIIRIGTFGYSIGFFMVAIFTLFLMHNFRTFTLAILGNSVSLICWIIIRIYLCKCLAWWIISLLEAGIAFGTAIGYMSAIQLVQRGDTGIRRWKIIGLAIGVSLGSLISFVLWKLVGSASVTIDIISIFSLISGILMTIVIYLTPEVTIYGRIPSLKFTWNFSVFILGVMINFGIVVTFFNDATNMILASEPERWDPEIPLICLVIGNLIGRISGLAFKTHLEYTPFLFGAFSAILALLQFALIIYWNFELIIINLVVNGIFFGLIWTLTLPLTKDFFGIGEDYALGNCSLAMAIGPLLYGFFASWIYNRHEFPGGCDQMCFLPFLIFSVITQLIAIIAYISGFFLVKRYREYYPLV